MNMIRPEAKAQLIRWRETLMGGAIILWGLWWLIGPGQLLLIPAVALMIGGAALVWIGVQRARFRGVGGGLGAVDVDEGQISYFGPLTGGAVALRELSRLTLDRSARPAHWRLDQPGVSPLMIPVDAEGADALFDAFATLPGLRTERMVTELQKREPHSIVIWERIPLKSAQLPLH